MSVIYIFYSIFQVKLSSTIWEDTGLFIRYNSRMLLTIDIGTSNFKSAIWNYEGNRVAFAAFHLSINLSEGVFHEADSGQWLRAFEDCCRSLGAEVPLAAVEAVVISGNGPTLVPLLGIRDRGSGIVVRSIAILPGYTPIVRTTIPSP
jgi:hypothetical protein